MKKGLGKGFGSLLPDDFDTSVMLDKGERVQKILIQDIVADPDQPRKVFEPESIRELSQSIKRYGILQPLVITKTPNGYLIIAGERRYRAAKQAGLTHVPALVRTMEDLEKLEIGLIENMQRVDLSPLEQALSMARLNEQFSMSFQDIAERLGKAHTTVVNTVRLLQLPEHARSALETKAISEGHARAVLALKDNPDAQKQLVEMIVKNGWSVRQAESYVQQQKQAKSPVKKAPIKVSAEEKTLSKKYQAAVQVKSKKQGGVVSFSFDSNTKLAQFLEHMHGN